MEDHLRYQLKNPPKTGGQGRVYRAYDPSMERIVAFKTLKPDIADDPAARDRLVREARFNGRLDHPNIVPVYDFGHYPPPDEQPYFVMRYVDGKTFKEAISEHHAATAATGSVDPSERRRLLRILAEVSDAIAYSHSCGVVHCDLKPENIVLGNFGEVYLLDWGLAKDLVHESGSSQACSEKASNSLNARLSQDADGQDDEYKTRYPRLIDGGGRRGSPLYMSPEQAAGDYDRINETTDIYGLGALLYEILIGQPPHVQIPSPDGVSFFGWVASRPTPRVRQTAPSVPEALDEICAKAMDRDQANRYAAAAEFAATLRSWLEDEPLIVYKRAIEQYKLLFHNNSSEQKYLEALSSSLVSLGLVLHGMGRNLEAKDFLRSAVDNYKQLVAYMPRVIRFRAELANTRIKFAWILDALGEAAEADKARRTAQRDWETLRFAGKRDAAYQSVISAILLTDDRSVEHSIVNAEVGSEEDDGERDDSADLCSESSSAFSSIVAAPREGPVATVDKAAGLERVLQSDPSYLPERSRDFATNAPGPIGEDPLPPFGEFDHGSPRYRFLRRLSSGGMGHISLAFDNELQREVVIKEGRSNHLGRSNNYILYEALICSYLDCTNIPSVYSIGLHSNGEHYFAMKYIRGMNLREHIKIVHATKRYNRSDFIEGLHFLLHVFIVACETLEFAHNKGVIHRDPKPDNIMVGSFNETFLVDWGLAIFLSTPEGVDIVSPFSPNEIAGTYAFMSPESFVGIDGIPRDIWCLGVTLYNILTNDLPFKRYKMVEMIAEIRSENKIVGPRRVNPWVPKKLEAICLKALQRETGDRYQSAIEMAKDVRTWMYYNQASKNRSSWMRQLVHMISNWNIRKNNTQ